MTVGTELPRGTANFCRGCGRDFTSVEAFKRHRIGRRDDTRCKTPEEMRHTGLELRGHTPDGVERWRRVKDGSPDAKARLDRLGGRGRPARRPESPRTVGGVGSTARHSRGATHPSP